MVDYTIGVTFKFEKKKPAPITGNVFYKSGQHIIEIHSSEDASKFIRGLIPPYPEEMMTKTTDDPKHEESRGKGIG